MEMNIDIRIKKIEVKVKRLDPDNGAEPMEGSLLGFAEVKFFGDDGAAFIVRGYTIKMKRWGLHVDAPAYQNKRSKGGFAASFAIDPPELWGKVKDSILKEFKAQPAIDRKGEGGKENIDPDEVPF